MNTLLLQTARRVVETFRDRRLTLATAESCTGGGAGAAVTAVPGASEIFAGGVISYSNDVKARVLDVSPETLVAHGAVSGECAKEMAAGAARLLAVDVAVSITGIAGPGGGTPQKPVGTVWFGLKTRGSEPSAECCRFSGTREEIRTQAAIHALELALGGTAAPAV